MARDKIGGREAVPNKYIGKQRMGEGETNHELTTMSAPFGIEYPLI